MGVGGVRMGGGGGGGGGGATCGRDERDARLIVRVITVYRNRLTL